MSSCLNYQISLEIHGIVALPGAALCNVNSKGLLGEGLWLVLLTSEMKANCQTFT